MKKTNNECLNKMDLDLIHLIKNGVFYCARKNSMVQYDECKKCPHCPKGVL